VRHGEEVAQLFDHLLLGIASGHDLGQRVRIQPRGYELVYVLGAPNHLRCRWAKRSQLESIKAAEANVGLRMHVHEEGPARSAGSRFLQSHSEELVIFVPRQECTGVRRSLRPRPVHIQAGAH